MKILSSNKVKMIIGILILLLLTACSTNTDTGIYTQQEVQTGTIVTTKRVIIKPEPIKPRGNFGVSIGSGGHSGVYGAVDILTLGNFLGIKRKDKVMQEIIIKRPNGKLVAVTQPCSSPFNQGDNIKIVKRGAQARVIH